ncbi:PKD domain-containing protein [Desulfobacterales bacterium HSG2]|nr:PKD domain-containing protein [Desulfobacterales bacterium HSG2]
MKKITIATLVLLVLGAGMFQNAHADTPTLFQADDSQFVYIKCLGHIEGARYLDGNTVEGTVNLVSSISDASGFTGTKWQMIDDGGDGILLKCLGHIEGPRYLNGRTVEGTVELVSETEELSGTRWEIIENDDGSFIKCLGHIEGARYLNGITYEGSVGLVHETSGCSGAMWQIIPVEIPVREYWILSDGYSGDFTNNLTKTVSDTEDSEPHFPENICKTEYKGDFTGSRFQKYDSAGNVLYYGYRQENGNDVVTDGVVLLPEKMELGKTYSVDYQGKVYDSKGNISGSEDHSLQTAITATETITVASGDFPTYKLRMTDNWTDDQGNSFSNSEEYWLARNIGSVRENHDGKSYELESNPFGSYPFGHLITPDLWIRAVIHTDEKGPVEAVWQKGGEDSTEAGDRVIWGYFYASPIDVAWGNQNNPDLFVKIWFDRSGRTDVNYFHVSVPEIEVYSDYPYDGLPDEQDMTTTDRRYIRQHYLSGMSDTEEGYEDGTPPSGYPTTGDPVGYVTLHDLRIGSQINIENASPIEAVWKKGGEGIMDGHEVIWGHFYASPEDVNWGSPENPDLFVKLWFDKRGRVDVNFFHVSVPNIEVYSDFSDDSLYDEKGTTILKNRYVRHEYWKDEPTSDFQFSPTIGRVLSPVKFFDRSAGFVTSRLWEFGDGKSSTEKNPEHTYSEAGGYSVTLTVENSAGSSSKTKYIEIKDDDLPDTPK